MSLFSDIAESLYSCTPPVKTDCDLFCFMGTSIMNGYAASTVALDPEFVASYFPAGDQTDFRRFGSLVVETPYNLDMFFPYLNKSHNYSQANARFGPEWTFVYAMKNQIQWTRPIFLFSYCANGVTLIEGEAVPSWSANETGGTFDLMIDQLKVAVASLKKSGYNPRISVVFGSYPVTSTTASDYETEVNAFNARVRTELEDSTIRFLWCSPVSRGGANCIAYRDGIDDAVASDALVESFDMDWIRNSGDDTHPHSLGVMNMGFLFASHWYAKYITDDRPVVSNVLVTGTLQHNTQIGASYTYSGGTENTGVVEDEYRFRVASGTRIELYYADDNVGTNETPITEVLNKGETWTLNFVGDVGKYIQARVFPKSQSGAVHGLPVDSAWQGPVTA